MDVEQAARRRRLPSPEDIERSARAFELSASKQTYRQIAERMDVSLGTVHNLVKRGMRFYLADHGAEDTKRAILGRLNAMLEALMPKALDGDEGAIDRVLKIDKRLAELYGLDAPKTIKIQPIRADTIDSELERLKAMEAALAANDDLPQPNHS